LSIIDEAQRMPPPVLGARGGRLSADPEPVVSKADVREYPMPPPFGSGRLQRAGQSYPPYALAGIATALCSAAGSGPASAVALTLAWEPVDDARVAVYQVHYGTRSARYDAMAETSAEQARIAGLDAGRRYFFAVRACTAGSQRCSDFSAEVSIVTASDNPAPGDGLVVEFTEATLDHTGTWVDLQQRFHDPVVIAKLATHNGPDPVQVAIDDIASDGFWAQLREWDYLDGWHVLEEVEFLAVERGVQQLPNGRWLEADSFELDGGSGFVRVPLFAPFLEPPVVLTAVTGLDGGRTVAPRVRRVAATEFELALSEQELGAARIVAETVDFIAIEPGIGDSGDWSYEVGHTATVVSDEDFDLLFKMPFASMPVLFADLQTTHGGDPATLRWRGLDQYGAVLWVQEEQSRDDETDHVAEQAGYLAIGRTR
jgi:hypothetical protein